MPYIVTVKRARPTRCPFCGGPVSASDDYYCAELCGWDGERASRRAVATLDEAQNIAQEAIDNGPPISSKREWDAWDALYDNVVVLEEPGGTIGPLPDGTLIEVERVDWVDLSRSSAIGEQFVDTRRSPTDIGKDIIAAYNAAQEVPA